MARCEVEGECDICHTKDRPFADGLCAECTEESYDWTEPHEEEEQMACQSYGCVVCGPLSERFLRDAGELSFEQANALGYDATGRFGAPEFKEPVRFPVRWCDLTVDEAHLLAIHPEIR